MVSGVRFIAAGLVIATTAGLTACGTSSSSGPGQTSAPCTAVEPLEGWSDIYSACVNSNDTFTQLTNKSEWDVVLLAVAPGASVPGMDVSLPPGSSLQDMVEQTEFSGSGGGEYALVPPGATFSATSAFGAPVHMNISVDFSATAENVTAMGLVDVVADKVNPVQSEAQAIVTCANYVHSLPEQINQSQPSSPEFWNNFASTAQCYGAFSDASKAINGGETAVIDDAAEETGTFFDDVLPKLVSLVSESIFR